ncbi:unnamed protein product [Allacma fusca]|uniref:NADPH:adrenodoxin oxidoreductase, mitochondrial n=1 Tax=Allacma fusca TaxID=39272 RepID=A0A8J2K0A2_9HEXA|nr:unnamed protein product [Allacma fusca]
MLAIKIIQRCKHVCVIGSGPGGLYAAQHLIKHGSMKVDVYERLPVPFGLVRYGVAPDHPEVKNVVNSFNKVLSHPNVRFRGNVTIGEDVNLNQLMEAYDAVLLSYGSSEDRKLNIPGEEFVTSARQFVGWYNGLPENSNLQFDLSNSETAFIVGQGNVALDVARILLSPIDKLAKTDIASHALETLSKSRIKRVSVIGRRGPLQVSFTIKELRELIGICPTQFREDDFYGINVDELPRPKKRLVELMINTSKIPLAIHDKYWTLEFLRSPLQITKDNNLKVKFALNQLQNEKVVPVGEEIRNCDIVFRSVGYQGKILFPELPWDERSSIIPNVEGKVSEGIYVTGWLKTGPRGVILNTMSDAFAVAGQILKDLESPSSSKPGLDLNLKKRITSYEDYMKIIEYEKSNGKVTSVQKMLEIIQ